MPYIKKENRKKFDEIIQTLSNDIVCEGDINYIVTSLLHLELLKRGLCYQNINNLVGALECAKLEFYRIIAAPYEDKKILENGPLDILQHEKTY